MLIGQEVTVLGAGIGGLAAAIALARRGASVEVLEQAAALGEVGAGIQISPNGARVLAALGLEGELAAIGLQAEAVELRDGLDGRQILRIGMAERGPGMRGWFLHRADLIEMLCAAATAAGVRVRFGRRVEEVVLADDGPHLREAGGAPRRVALLIGADGIHSRLRAAMGGPAKPFFTGAIAWRATIPADGAQPPVAEIHAAPRRHVVSYPLRGGSLRNIVAVETRTRWVDESWSLREDGLALRAGFADFGPRVRGWLDAAAEPWLWGLFRHEVASRWGWVAPAAPNRGAVLLGDAAHPTLPFLAQGANMALEDGWVLARALSEHDALLAAFEVYEAARAPRCRRIVEASGGAARLYHLRPPVRALAHVAMRAAHALAPGLVARRYDWIHRHDVTRTP
jgi:salicylate hydroxylase